MRNFLLTLRQGPRSLKLLLNYVIKFNLKANFGLIHASLFLISSLPAAGSLRRDFPHFFVRLMKSRRDRVARVVVYVAFLG